MKNKVLFGGATAANQFEGGWDKDGKGISIADIRNFDPNLDRKSLSMGMTSEKIQKALNSTDMFFPNRHGSEFFAHYKEDIKMLKEMGNTIFRMSISWPRIFPNGDEKKANQKGLDFYRSVFEELKSNGIEPLVTISHYETPLYLVTKYGGWKNKKLIEFYKNYAKTVFTEYKDLVKYWMPFNEINCATMGWIGNGLMDDEADDMTQLRYQAMHNLFVANAWAVKIGHEINPNFQIGSMVAGMPTYPLTCKPEDVLADLKEHQYKVLFFFEVMSNGEYPSYMTKFFEIKNINLDIAQDELKVLKEGVVDFNGFSYYMSGTTSAEFVKENETNGNLFSIGKNPYLKATEWGWQIDPIGLRIFMNQIYSTFKKPIFIAENGIGMVEKMRDENDIIQDDYRIDYLREHFKNIKNAIEIDGVNLIGYTMWGIIDLVSASTCEMSKRYGIIYVDQDDYGNGTLKRYKKKSFNWFKKAIESNLEDLN